MTRRGRSPAGPRGSRTARRGVVFDHLDAAERPGSGPRHSRDPLARGLLEVDPTPRRSPCVSSGARLRALARRRRARLPRRSRGLRGLRETRRTRAARRLRGHASRPECSAAGRAGSPRPGSSRCVTATSPRRLPHPAGGEPLTGTNPLAIAIPPPTAGRSSPTSRWAPSPTATCSRAGRGRRSSSLRRRAGAQGVRARGRARAARRRARRAEHGAVLLAARPEHDPVPPSASSRPASGCRATAELPRRRAGRRAPARARPRRTRGPPAARRSNRCRPACRSGRGRTG